MGMKLWGESHLYENLKVFIVIMDTNKSASRRQGSLWEGGLKEVGVQTIISTNRPVRTRIMGGGEGR